MGLGGLRWDGFTGLTFFFFSPSERPLSDFVPVLSCWAGFFGEDRTGVRSMSIRSVSLVVADDTSDVTMVAKAIVLVAMFGIPDLQGAKSRRWWTFMGFG